MWNDRYSEPGFAYGQDPNDFLAEVAAGLNPGRILCLAEGEGRNAVWLAERGHTVVAVDSSEVGLNKANELAAKRGVEIETVVADLRTFEIDPEGFDAVVAIFAHLPPDLRAQVHRAAVAGLRPGGTLILEAYTPEQLDYGTGGPPAEPMLYRLEDLRGELEGLELKIAREVVRAIHEGAYHHGEGAVVQILGLKPA